MKGKKHKLSFLLALIMLFTVACQAPTSSTDDQTKTDSNKAENETADGNSDVLDIMIPNFYNDVEKEQWGTVVEKFKEMNPDIEVNLTNGDVQVESGKLPTLLQSGIEPPDVILMNGGPGRVSILSDVNLIQPLNELYDKNNWKDALRPFAYDLISRGENIFEVPHMTDATALFYNKDIFEQHGVELPTTNEEFLKALQTLKEAGVAPITVGARNGYAIGWLFGSMMESVMGTEKVKELLYGDGKWNDPEVVQVAQLMADWVEEGYITKESVTQTEADSKFRFLSKQAAISANGTYLITDIADQKLEDSVDMMMIPSFVDGDVAQPIGGVGLTWVVPTKAQNVDYAEKWMDFILSKEYSEIVLNMPDYNFIPASKASMDIEPVGEVLKSAMRSTEEGSGYNPSVFIGVEAKEAYYQNLQGLVGGLITPQEAMDNIEKGAEKDRENGYSLD